MICITLLVLLLFDAGFCNRYIEREYGGNDREMIMTGLLLTAPESSLNLNTPAELRLQNNTSSEITIFIQDAVLLLVQSLGRNHASIASGVSLLLSMP